MIPHIKRYKTIKSGHAGEAKLFVVTIDPRYKDDKGLLAHELRHVLHWWVVTLMCLCAWVVAAQYVSGQVLALLLPVCFLAYDIAQLIPSVKLWVEVDCYAEQLNYYDNMLGHARLFGEYIATRYGLDISASKATRLILERFN